MSASDKQVGGDHYHRLGEFQPWDVLRHWLTPEEYRGWMKGNAIVYLARERQKGGDQDIEKAAHHLQKLVEVLADPPVQHDVSVCCGDFNHCHRPCVPREDYERFAERQRCCGAPSFCENPCFHQPASKD